MNLTPPPRTDNLLEMQQWMEDLYQYLQYPVTSTGKLLPRSTAPTGEEGRIYYDSDPNAVLYYDGTEWRSIANPPGRTVDTTRITDAESPYTVLAADEEIFCDSDGGAITANLPAGIDGTNYRIINTGSASNLVTVAPNGAELLTGVNASRTLSDKSVIVLTYQTTEGWW